MRPLLLGHRGARASQQIPENTLESFELCMEHGCDGFEFDVRCSADGIPVICHDPTIRGMQIDRTTADQLALPRLDDVLRRFATRAFLDIEVKVEGLESQLIAALRAYPPTRDFVVSSFLPAVLTAVGKLDANIPLGLIFDQPNQVEPPGPSFSWTIPHFTLVSRALADEAHTSGKRIMTWTVNRADEMLKFAGCGIDAIISDDTELLVRSFR
ncbi:MAG: glycerophosphodiester phosphodiesterase [Terriglobales bacterium]